MSSWKIIAVRVAKTGSDRHDHITAVKATLSDTSGIELNTSTVVNDLRDPNGDRYYTYAGGERADVYARTCPWCGSREYITTSPDSTRLNNLLSLPRF